MPVRAVVLDIGGGLEITTDPQMRGVMRRWETGLGLQPDELAKRIGSKWEAGALGTCSEEDV